MTNQKHLKLLIVWVLFIGLTFTSQAQRYKSGLGLRVNLPLELSYKHFINKDKALELSVGYGKFLGTSTTIIRTAGYHHMPLDKNVEGLDLFLGAGAGLYISKAESLLGFIDIEDFTYYEVGLNGFVGFEYVFKEYPVALSIDWTPGIIIGDSDISGLRFLYGALTGRYLFGKLYK